MKDYQERVRKEKEELDIKINKLCAFIHSAKWSEVRASQRDLLEQQIIAMMSYSKALRERIVDFNR